MGLLGIASQLSGCGWHFSQWFSHLFSLCCCSPYLLFLFPNSPFVVFVRVFVCGIGRRWDERSELLLFCVLLYCVCCWCLFSLVLFDPTPPLFVFPSFLLVEFLISLFFIFLLPYSIFAPSFIVGVELENWLNGSFMQGVVCRGLFKAEGLLCNCESSGTAGFPRRRWKL